MGLSRSVLAERFADLVGMPPMQYLAKWRMQIASGLLSGGSANVATVAAEIGYGIRGGFQPRFQEDGGDAALGLASRASRMMARIRCLNRQIGRGYNGTAPRDRRHAAGEASPSFLDDAVG